MFLRAKYFRRMLVAGFWLIIWYTSASAHGGMAGPDELGPPVIISTILGIGGYWTVMLWPSRKNVNNEKTSVRRPPPRRNRSA
jgi:hypothetical protein